MWGQLWSDILSRSSSRRLRSSTSSTNTSICVWYHLWVTYDCHVTVTCWLTLAAIHTSEGLCLTLNTSQYIPLQILSRISMSSLFNWILCINKWGRDKHFITLYFQYSLFPLSPSHSLPSLLRGRESPSLLWSLLIARLVYHYCQVEGADCRELKYSVGRTD